MHHMVTTLESHMTLWRNGSASDSRSEGCVFKSRQGQRILLSKLSSVFSVIHFHSNFKTHIKLEQKHSDYFGGMLNRPPIVCLMIL